MDQENDGAKSVAKYSITRGRKVWDEECKKGEEEIEKEEPGHELERMKRKSPSILSNFSWRSF